MRAITSLVFAGSLAWCSFSAAQAPNPLPPGEGREVVAGACAQCHGPNVFTQLRQGPDAWRRQVYDMILRGAQVQPVDVEPVVKYLVTNFGPGNNVPPAMVKVTLPDGAGRELVEQRCTLCHGLDRAAGVKRSKAEWDLVLSRMIFLGAPVAGDELKTVSAYLKDKLATR
jgi:mono/diheme cytochrome c family protein